MCCCFSYRLSAFVLLLGALLLMPGCDGAGVRLADSGDARPAAQSDSVRVAGGGVGLRCSAPIDSSSQPLYVVDGIPLTRGNDEAAEIDPADISSIEVLAHPASAVYGTRGEHGAVLITTK